MPTWSADDFDTGSPVTKEDVQTARQQDFRAATGDSKWGHLVDMVSDAVSHVLPDTAGFFGDLLGDAAKLAVPSLPIKLHLPGTGPIAQKIGKTYDKATGIDKAEIPEGRGERYAYTAARGAADSVPFAAEAPLQVGRVLLSGASGGAGANLASELFPGSEAAQFVGGLLGGVAGAGVHPAITKYKGVTLAMKGSQRPDFPALVDTVLGLEGGGSLDHPKVNAKSGATGPMQVTPDTARAPGYGIRPWNGKTQADLARVGRQKLAVLMGKYDDPEKALAAYNWGEGNVDHAVGKYGDNWFYHAPSETQHYVVDGMTKAYGGARSASEHGVPPISPGDMANIMGDTGMQEADLIRNLPPANREYIQSELDGNLPEDIPHPRADETPVDEQGNPLSPEGNNVVDLSQARIAKEDRMNDSVIDENLDMADKISRAIDAGKLNADDHLPYITSARDNLQGILEDFSDRLTREQSERIQDNIDSLNQSIDKLGSPVADKPTDIADRTQAILDDIGQGGGPREAANLNDDRFVGKLPEDGVAPARLAEDGKVHIGEGDGIVTKDGTYMSREQAKEFVKKTDMPESENLVQLIKRLLKDEEGSLKGSDDAKGRDGQELPNLKKQKNKLLDKLGDALEQGTPIRREAEAAIMQERARRLAAIYKVRETKGGEAGFYSELSALKGEMGRPKIESIRHWFSQPEIDHLYDIVGNSPELHGYDSVVAKKALNKLLGKDYGEIPTAREVELLAKAMPRQAKIWRQLLENEEGAINLPDGAIKRGVVNVAGLPRTLKASFDFSAPFRQGMFLVGRKEFWKAMPGMFKSFFSEGHFEKVQEEIANRPTYGLMNRAGLETTKNNAGLIDREEAFISQFAESIPGVRHSERAYIAFLNKLRADTFDDFVRKGEEMGIDFVHEPSYLKSAAKFINSATGRGNLSAVTRDARILSNIFFSPKLMKSRLDLLNLNPGYYASLHPAVRVEAAKSGLIYSSVVLSTLGMATAAGASVDWDPRSSDFLKIKLGNTRFDVTGGFQPYVRFFAQFLMGQQKGINDGKVRNIGSTLPIIRSYFPGVDQGKFKPTTRKDILYTFFENKESPNAAEITRLLRESDAVGNPLGSQSNPITTAYTKVSGQKTPAAVNEAIDMFTPLIVSDTYQAYQDLGAKGILTAIPNAGGVGVQTYTPKKKKSGNTFSASDFGGKEWSKKDFE